MRKKVSRLAALAYAILLCGCGDKEEFLIPEEKELIPVQFNIGLKQEVLPFPDTKSIPPLNIPEPSPVKSSEEEQLPGTEALYSRIDYVVYSDENSDTPLKRKSYTTEDPDFTIVYDSLPAGDYHICFRKNSLRICL